MRNLSLAFSAAFFSLANLAAGAALADVAPPQTCDGAIGSACNNAGPNGDQAGTCQNAMCPHTGPGPGGAGGALVTTEEPCTLCTLTSSSSSGSATTGAGGGESTGAYSSSSGSGSSGGGCSIGARTGDGMIAGAMLMIGLGVLLSDRRRRRGG